MPPDRLQHHIKAHEIYHDKELVVSFSSPVPLSIIQVTVRFCSSPPIKRENTLGVVRCLAPLFPFRQPQDLRLGSPSPCRKGTTHLLTLTLRHSSQRL
ncbi:hypothetical protein TNCV_2792551 [Trichonephila clavipes]|nr:hypothetical protein TNCV_2792551 [Trichonephila clavipes]